VNSTDDVSDDSNVSYDRADGVATLQFERPAKKNAITRDMREEIRTALDRFERSDDAVLVVRGSGDSFSAGTDVNELTERQPADASESVLLDPFSLPERLADVEKPVIAMLNGVALGGGLELALACDFRVAGDDVRVGFPEITLGGIPGEGGTQRLPRETNSGTALRLLLTGDLVDAERARRDGLVQEVYPQADLEDRTYELAREVAKKDVASLVLAKRAVRAADQTDLAAGLEIETLFANLVETFPNRKARLDEFLDG